MEERKNQVILYRLFVGNNNNLVDQISSLLPIVKVSLRFVSIFFLIFLSRVSFSPSTFLSQHFSLSLSLSLDRCCNLFERGSRKKLVMKKFERSSLSLPLTGKKSSEKKEKRERRRQEKEERKKKRRHERVNPSLVITYFFLSGNRKKKK